MTKAVFSIAPHSISHDTVRCLEQLLAGARAGHVRGIAFALLLKRYRYMVNAAGEAYSNPVRARGATHCLDDCLAKLCEKQDATPPED